MDCIFARLDISRAEVGYANGEKADPTYEEVCNDGPLAVEVMGLKNFYSAEEYHQKYLDKNPTGYCHISPVMMNIKKQK